MVDLYWLMAQVDDGLCCLFDTLYHSAVTDGRRICNFWDFSNIANNTTERNGLQVSGAVIRWTHCLNACVLGPFLLRWYCAYVLLNAMNGVTEGFKNATMSDSQVNRYVYKHVIFD